MCPYWCLSIYQCNLLAIWLSIFLSFLLSKYLCIFLAICLFFYLSIDQCIILALYLSICISFFLSVYLSSYLSCYLSIYLFIIIYICLSIYLLSFLLSFYPCMYLFCYLSIFLCIYLSIFLAIFLSLNIENTFSLWNTFISLFSRFCQTKMFFQCIFANSIYPSIFLILKDRGRCWGLTPSPSLVLYISFLCVKDSGLKLIGFLNMVIIHNLELFFINI